MNDDILKSNQEKINQAKESFKQDQNGQSSSSGNISSSTLEEQLVRYTFLRNLNGLLFIITAGLMLRYYILLADCKGSDCAGGIILAFLFWPLVIFLIVALVFNRKIKKNKKIDPKR